MVKHLIQKIILKLLPLDLIQISLDYKKIKRCNQQVTIGNTSRFYEEAKVFNFLNKKDAIQIGEGTHIRGELMTFGNGGKIRIGSNTFIGEGTRIWSGEEVIIGDNVLISHNCNIMDTNSHEMDHLERAKGYQDIINLGHSKEKTNVLTKPVFIGDFVWISFNVTILKGVRIGKGAIIAAGSVVTKDVEEFTMVAGNPAVFKRNVS